MNRQAQRILLVDDDPEVLRIWGRLLRALDFDVRTAANGLTALALAQSAPPDLIVLDLELPGISGAETARELRHNPLTMGIPLIAATGETSTLRLDEARHAGFDVVLAKPCDSAELVGEIVRLLERRAELAAAEQGTTRNE